MESSIDVLLRLISSLERQVSHMPENRIFDEDFARLSCAILRILYSNLDPAGRIAIKQAEYINENIEICRRSFFEKIYGGEQNSLGIANQLPLFIANMIMTEGAGVLYGQDFAPMVCHQKSDVRLWTFRTLWLVKDRLDNGGIIHGLLFNLSENLGYVSEAAGLLRGIVGDDGRFHRAASMFDPSTRFRDQFKNRIERLRDKNSLMRCVKLLADFEISIVALTEAPGI